MRILWTAFVFAQILAVSSSAFGQSRLVALVIGNGQYEAVGMSLTNPSNDAKLIAGKLEMLGYEVITALDQDEQGMRAVLREFDRALINAQTGLVYYAGHGMEYQGRNYLFPVDAKLESAGDVGLSLIEVTQVMEIMESRVQTRLLFLDACRNNPLTSRFRGLVSGTRAANIGTGLGRMEAAVGTFIAYATAPGEVAADGRGRNSPFTEAVANRIVEPNVTIGEFMRRVRNDVMKATGGQQVPWESSSLTARFIFNPEAVAPPIDIERVTENLYWQSIVQSNSSEDFYAYLERFGSDGTFAKLAQNRIAALRRAVPSQPLSSTSTNKRPVAPIDEVRDPIKAEKSLKLSVGEWRAIQIALKKIGFDPRGIDGIPGSLTRAAIFRWQQANNEKVTGYLSKNQAAQLLSIN